MEYLELVDHLRNALKHLYDLEYLRHSPLTRLFKVDGRFNTPLALQQVLIEAIEALQSTSNEPAHARNQELYDLLQYRYIEQFTQDEVALQLGVSKRQVRRKQNQALEVLTYRLWEKYGTEGVEQPSGVPVIAGSNQGQQPSNRTTDDLSWLGEANDNQQTALAVLFATVVELTESLANINQVQLIIHVPPDLPPVAVHPMALRQAMLSCLSAFISLNPGQAIRMMTTFDDRARISIQINTRLTVPGTLEQLTPALQMAQQLLEPGGSIVNWQIAGPVLDLTIGLMAVGGIKVLVVDDNVEIYQLIERFTSNTRYQPYYAPEPVAVFAMIAEQQPDIILLDIMMPQVDGLELLGRLREHPRTAHIPVIICSILPQESLVLSLGARAFISKPIDRVHFLATLNRVVNESQSTSH